MDWTAIVTLSVAVTGLLTALTPLLAELRKWWFRVPPDKEHKS